MPAPSSQKFRFLGLTSPDYFANLVDPNLPMYTAINTNTFVSSPGILKSRGGYVDLISIPDVYEDVDITTLNGFISQEIINPERQTHVFSHHIFKTNEELREFFHYNPKPPIKEHPVFNEEVIPSVSSWQSFPYWEGENTTTAQEQLINKNVDYVFNLFDAAGLDEDDLEKRNNVRFTQPRMITVQRTETHYDPVRGAAIYSDYPHILDFTLDANIISFGEILDRIGNENKGITLSQEINYEEMFAPWSYTTEGSPSAEVTENRKKLFRDQKLLKIDPEKLGFKKQSDGSFKILGNPEYSRTAFEPASGKIDNFYLLLYNEDEDTYNEYIPKQELKNNFYMVVSDIDGRNLKKIVEIGDNDQRLNSREFSNIEKTYELYILIPASNAEEINQADNSNLPLPVFSYPTINLSSFISPPNTAVNFPLPVAPPLDFIYNYSPGEEIIKDVELLPTLETVFMRNVPLELDRTFYTSVSGEEKHILTGLNLRRDNTDEYQYVRYIGTEGVIQPFPDYDVTRNRIAIEDVFNTLQLYVRRDATLIPVGIKKKADDVGIEMSTLLNIKFEDLDYLTSDQVIFGSNFMMKLRGLDNKYYYNSDIRSAVDRDPEGLYAYTLYEAPEDYFNGTRIRREILKFYKYGVSGRFLAPDYPFDVQRIADPIYDYVSIGKKPENEKIRVYKIDEDKLTGLKQSALSHDRQMGINYREEYTNIRICPDYEEDRVGGMHLVSNGMGLYTKNNEGEYVPIRWNINPNSTRTIYTLMYKRGSSYTKYRLLHQDLLQTFPMGASRYRKISFARDSLYLVVIPKQEEGKTDLYDKDLHIVYGDTVLREGDGDTVDDFRPEFKTISVPMVHNCNAVHYIPNVKSLPNYLDFLTLPNGLQNGYFSEIHGEAHRVNKALMEIQYFPLHIYKNIYNAVKDKTVSNSEIFRDYVFPAVIAYRYTKEDLHKLKILPLHINEFNNIFEEKDQTILIAKDRPESPKYKYIDNEFIDLQTYSINGYSSSDTSELELHYYDSIDDENKIISLKDLFTFQRQENKNSDSLRRDDRNRYKSGLRLFSTKTKEQQLKREGSIYIPYPFLPLLRRSKRGDICKKLYEKEGDRLPIALGRLTGARLPIALGDNISDILITPNLSYELFTKYTTPYTTRVADQVNTMFPYNMSEAYLGIQPIGEDDQGNPIYPENIKIVAKHGTFTEGTKCPVVNIIEAVQKPKYDGVTDVVQMVKDSINADYNTRGNFSLNNKLEKFRLDPTSWKTIKGYSSSTDLTNKISLRVGHKLIPYSNLYMDRLESRLDSGNPLQSETDRYNEYVHRRKQIYHLASADLFSTFSVYKNSFGDFVHPLLRVTTKDKYGKLYLVPYADRVNAVITKDTPDSILKQYFVTAQKTGLWSYYMTSKTNEYDIVENLWVKAKEDTYGQVYSSEIGKYFYPSTYPFYDQTYTNYQISLPDNTENDFLDFSAYSIDQRKQTYSLTSFSPILAARAWSTYYATASKNYGIKFMPNEYQLFRALQGDSDQSSRGENRHEFMSMIVFDLKSTATLLEQVKNLSIVTLELPNYDANYLPPILKTNTEFMAIEIETLPHGITQSVDDFIGQETGERTTYTTREETINDRVPNRNWGRDGYTLIGNEYIRQPNTIEKRIEDQGYDNRIWFSPGASRIPGVAGLETGSFSMHRYKIFADDELWRNSRYNEAPAPMLDLGKVTDLSARVSRKNIFCAATTMPIPAHLSPSGALKGEISTRYFYPDTTIKYQENGEEYINSALVLRERNINNFKITRKDDTYHEYSITNDELEALAPARASSTAIERQSILPSKLNTTISLWKDNDNVFRVKAEGLEFSKSFVDLMTHNPGEVPREESLPNFKFLVGGPFFPVDTSDESRRSTTDERPYIKFNTTNPKYRLYPSSYTGEVYVGDLLHTIGGYKYKRKTFKIEPGTTEIKKGIIPGLFDISDLEPITGRVDTSFMPDPINFPDDFTIYPSPLPDYVYKVATRPISPQTLTVEFHFIRKGRKLSSTPYLVDPGLVVRYNDRITPWSGGRRITINTASDRRMHISFEPTSAFTSFPNDDLSSYRVLPNEDRTDVEKYINSGVINRLDQPEHILDRLSDEFIIENDELIVNLKPYWAIYDFVPILLRSTETFTIMISDKVDITDNTPIQGTDDITLVQDINASKHFYKNELNKVMYGDDPHVISLLKNTPFENASNAERLGYKYEHEWGQGYVPVNIQVSNLRNTVKINTVGNLGFSIPVDASIERTAKETELLGLITPYLDGTKTINSLHPLRISMVYDTEENIGVKHLDRIKRRHENQLKFYIQTKHGGGYIVDPEEKTALPVPDANKLNIDSLSVIQKGNSILMVDGYPIYDENGELETGNTRFGYYKIIQENSTSETGTLTKMPVTYSALSTDRSMGSWMPQKIFTHDERIILIDPSDNIGRYVFMAIKSESDATETTTTLPADATDEQIKAKKEADRKAAFHFDLPRKQLTTHVVEFNGQIFTFTETNIYVWDNSKLFKKEIENNGLLSVAEGIVINKRVKPVVIHNNLMFVTKSNIIMYITPSPYRVNDYKVHKFTTVPTIENFEIKAISGGVIKGERILTILGTDGKKYVKNVDLQFSEVVATTPEIGYSKWETTNREFYSVHNSGSNMISTIKDRNSLVLAKYDDDESIDVLYDHDKITLRELQHNHNETPFDSSQTDKNIGIPLYYKGTTVSGLIGDIFNNFDIDLTNNKELIKIKEPEEGDEPEEPKMSIDTNTTLFKNPYKNLDDEICSIGYGIKVEIETLNLPNISKLTGNSPSIRALHEKARIENVEATVQNTDTFKLFIDDKEITSHRTKAAVPDGVVSELSGYENTSATVKIPIDDTFDVGKIRIEHETTGKLKLLALTVNTKPHDKRRA